MKDAASPSSVKIKIFSKRENLAFVLVLFKTITSSTIIAHL